MDNDSINMIRVAAALQRASEAEGLALKIAGLNRRILLNDGVLEVPIHVADGPKSVSVFVYPTPDQASAAQFAGVQALFQKHGQPPPVYYAPRALPKAPAANPLKPLDTYHFTKAERKPAKGNYAMWWNTPGDPEYGPSPAMQSLERIFQSLNGYEPLVYAMLLKEAGLIDDVLGPVKLPQEPHVFPLEATDGHVVLVSAMAEKGVRLHFHTTMPAKYRNLLLHHLATLGESIRNTAIQAKIPPARTKGSNPLGWFTFAREQASKRPIGTGISMFGAIEEP